MKINKIKINGFGNLINKEIILDNGINIIYGENESGKSTLLKFIISMFFGLSKNKNGKEISDYERYTSWNNSYFSGKLQYELDNKESFEIFREFNKRYLKIYDKNLVEISKTFNIDKNKGNQFFYEQTKIDEELFLSTVIIMQQQLKLDNNDQNILIQKITNLISSGDDNISFKKVINKLDKKLLEEVGTKRSQDRPINIINKRIEQLNQEKQNLEQYNKDKYEMEETKNIKEKELIKLNNKFELIKEIKIIKEKDNIEKEKIKLNKNIIDEYKEKISELVNKRSHEKNKSKNKLINKLIDKKNLLLLIIIFILNLISFIFIKNKIINYLFLLLIPLYFLLIYLRYKIKLIKEKNKINREKEYISREINILKENIRIKNNEIIQGKNKINDIFNYNKNKLINNYINKIDIKEIEELLVKENIGIEYEDVLNKINNLKLEIHSLELEYKNIILKLDKLSLLEEELENLKEQYSNIYDLGYSINLAKEYLIKAYDKMKNNITPKFTERLSQNISIISNGKYNNVKFNDENGLIVELTNGNYISADELSIGTIDQMYLSLRLSALNDVSIEKLPIILDEAFVYFDKNRLENCMKYLDLLDNQVIILTCSNREIDILNNLNIKYSLIEFN